MSIYHHGCVSGLEAQNSGVELRKAEEELHVHAMTGAFIEQTTWSCMLRRDGCIGINPFTE